MDHLARLRLLLTAFVPALAARAQLPLAFEPNVGQVAADATFVARGAGYEILIDARGFTTALLGRDGALRAVRFRVAGGAATPVEGQERAPGSSHYLHGRDPAGWRRHVPHWRSLRQRGVLQGVDLVYHGNERELEYDLVLAPGIAPGSVRLEACGIDRLALDGRGDLILTRGGEELRKPAPRAYQLRDGQEVEVACRYVLYGTTSFGFAAGEVDPSRPLTIDPVIVYASFLGAVQQDECRDVAVDATGNAFLVGWTVSSGFPVANALQGTIRGTYDMWIAKVDPTGSTLLFSTFLGGGGAWNNYEDALKVAVDGQGQPILLGKTSATDYPVTPGAFQPALAGSYDAVVTKLAANGSALLWSTYLGGSGVENAWPNSPNIPYGADIHVDAAGNTWVAGSTSSADFPLRAPLQPVYGGGGDAYLTAFDASGAVRSSTYLGGSSIDQPYRIARGPAGDLVLCGVTASPNFPVTAGAWYTSGGQGFVLELDATASRIQWSSLLPEVPLALDVDAAGFVYLGGSTRMLSFPVTSGAWQRVYSGANDQSNHGDGWIVKLTPDGRAPVWATLLGTYDSPDGVWDMAVDAQGHPYLLVNGDAVAGGAAGGTQIVKLATSGSAPCYEIWVASKSEGGTGMAVSPAASVWVVGTTSSTLGVKATANAMQKTFAGFRDGWIVRADDLLTGLSAFAVAQTRLTHNEATTGTVTIDGVAPSGGMTVGVSATPANALALPAQVTILGGTSSATFPIQVVTLPRGSVRLTATLGARTLYQDVSLYPGATYRVVDLSVRTPSLATSAHAISDSGFTTGGMAGTSGYLQHDATGTVSLTTEGRDVNRTGQVVLPTGYQQIAVYTPNQGYAPVPLFAGTSGGSGEAINDLGWVVGAAYTNPQGYARAFLYRPGQPTLNLGTLGGSASTAYGVSNTGHVVGEAFLPTGYYEPFLWQQSTGLKSLGLLPGHTYGRAYGVNDAGEVCGVSAAGTRGRAFLVAGGAMQDLGVPAGTVHTVGTDVNQHGQVVGLAMDAGNVPSVPVDRAGGDAGAGRARGPRGAAAMGPAVGRRHQ